MTASIPVIMSIAGFDPSSGAGITADLKTAAAHGCFGLAAITALTVQNTTGVKRVEAASPNLLRQTLSVLADDFEVSAVKVGMLADIEVARTVALFLEQLRPRVLVVDPILRSSSGALLLDERGREILVQRIFPLATAVTPNTEELGEILSTPIESLEQAARAKWLIKAGVKNVIVTGGHLPDNTDLLITEKGEEIPIPGPRIDSENTHGTGCAFSTALTCNLVNGMDIEVAAYRAKEYVREAVQQAPGLGKGVGPLNHFPQK